MKRIELINNNNGGIDLITDQSTGQPVRILTGTPKESIQYWKRMKSIAQDALDKMKTPTIHVIVINSKGKTTKRTRHIIKL